MVTVLDSLNAALHRAFAADTRVILLGEDVLDPYGGAFRVTRGLSTTYPERVLATPISEAGIVGVATGMAMRGLRPVVEIMFGDFLTLIADQVINHATKFRWMYGGNKSPQDQVHVPMVIRTPMGGRRGYGPTHSQTLEKFFLGVPGLRLLAPTNLGDPGGLLEEAILKTDDPVLFVENKLLYLAQILDGEGLGDFDLRVINGQGVVDQESYSLLPKTPSLTYSLTLRQAPSPTLTLAAYGYVADLARQAMLKLAYEHEIFTELVVPTQLAPFAVDPILNSAGRTGRLLVVEEGTFTLGWGAEILARAAESLGSRLKGACRLAARDLPVPSSGALENGVLPGVEDIVQRTVMLQSR
jgi:pyruvate/2-oxoglutarate/acetoin dehydrogenase E1 component